MLTNKIKVVQQEDFSSLLQQWYYVKTNMLKKHIIQKLWERRVVRFACIGVINTLTDAAILNVLVFVFGVKLLIANVISASVSIIISYFWNHYIVFQKEHQLSLRMFLKFVIVTGLSIVAIQSAVIYIAQHIFTLSEISKLTGLHGTHVEFIQVDGAKIAAVLIGMVWNFLLYKYVVFRHHDASDAADLITVA